MQPRFGEYSPAGHYAPMTPVQVEAKVNVETNTIWIWLAIVASVLPLATLFLIDWNGYIDAVVQTTRDNDPTALLEWEMRVFAVSLIGWVFLAAYIVLAWLDWRELRRRGVPRPFHWAWSFFAFLSGGLAVYIIGRTVVLHRRTTSGGWAPLWVWIAVGVLATVVVIIWTLSLVQTMMIRLSGLYA